MGVDSKSGWVERLRRDYQCMCDHIFAIPITAR
jgi:hypothetical protein